MEGPAGALKVNKSLRKVLLPHGKFMEGLADAQKVDGSYQNVLLMHEKLTEVDGRSCGCMES